MLEELLQVTEYLVNANRKYKNKFDTMLKKKFLDKSDVFACLDPFLCEFQYEGRKVSFIGDAAPAELARGVFESVGELTAELGLSRQLEQGLSSWAARHSKRIRTAGVGFFQGMVSGA
jgi:hypothetical protein